MLAVDPGTKRVGLAVSDPLGISANPLPALPARPDGTLAARIAAVARELEVERVVVGLPRRMDGGEGPEAKAARALATAVREAGKLPVSLVDERLTSAAAERHLVASDVRRARRRELSDEVAATLILRTYLDSEAARNGR